LGSNKAEELAKEFKTIDNLMNASFQQLNEVAGNVPAASVVNFFHNKKKIEILLRDFVHMD